jgi:hypothetical protein
MNESEFYGSLGDRLTAYKNLGNNFADITESILRGLLPPGPMEGLSDANSTPFDRAVLSLYHDLQDAVIVVKATEIANVAVAGVKAIIDDLMGSGGGSGTGGGTGPGGGN